MARPIASNAVYPRLHGCTMVFRHASSSKLASSALVRAARLRSPRNQHATVRGMIDTNPTITVMNDDDLLACTRELVRKSCATEAELLLHLAEIDERKLYAERAFPSMHVFCVKELGFSEGAAYNRIGVARAGRRWPAVLEALGSGAVHLAGLRVLVPHLTDENHESILAEASGKSKREIEEMAARLSPRRRFRTSCESSRAVQPPPCSNRRLPQQRRLRRAVPTRRFRPFVERS